MSRNKTLVETSLFETNQAWIWERLQKLHTLQLIAAPFATFSPIAQGQDLIWQEGNTFQFHFKLFGILPLGVHTISILRFDQSTWEICSREHNAFVPVWNHRIKLEKRSEDQTVYTDEVEIYAGWKTPIVFAWATLFYKHRQKRWRGMILDANRQS